MHYIEKNDIDKATVSTKCVKKRSRMEKVGRTRKSLSLKKKQEDLQNSPQRSWKKYYLLLKKTSRALPTIKAYPSLTF